MVGPSTGYANSTFLLGGRRNLKDENSLPGNSLDNAGLRCQAVVDASMVPAVTLESVRCSAQVEYAECKIT